MKGAQNHVCLSPQGVFSTALATPVPQETESPSGKNYQLPFGKYGDTNPGRQKIFRIIRKKNTEFRNDVFSS